LSSVIVPLRTIIRQVIIAGDILYEQGLADDVIPWLRELAQEGVDVYIGDPGRSFLPKDKLISVETYELPLEIQDDNYGHQSSAVWKISGGSE